MEDFEIGRKRRGSVPGTIYDNRGHWYWRVKLPGDVKRRAVPLRMPGAKHAMPSTKSRRDAQAAAWREWERATRTGQGRRPDGRTVEDVCAAWCEHLKIYYRDADGNTTDEASKGALAIRQLRALHGHRFCGDLEHTDMLAVRDAIIRTGVCRKTVNDYMLRAKRMWAWALDEGLIRAYVKAELSQVSPLKRNRSQAPETKPIRSVPMEVVERTASAMPPNLADMVRVQALTGMRPGEVCSFTFDEVDTSVEPWVYRPSHHKNSWREHPRVILIGPRARAILSKYRAIGGVPFSPARSFAELVAMRRAEANSPRKTPLTGFPERNVGDSWDTCAYTKAIGHSCTRAGTMHWSANQLRHVFATAVRRQFGIAAARAVLGHTDGSYRVTDMYSFEAAEEEYIKAATPAVEALG